MNASAALDLLMKRLGNRTEAALRATCLSEMNLAQETFLEGGSYLPWFLLSENLTVTITVNERRISVPTNFLREAEDSALWYINADSKKIELGKKSFDELAAHHTLEATAEEPEDYALLGEYFHLFPIPTIARTLVMKVFVRQAASTDAVGSENKWLKYAADLMIATAGEVVAATHLQSPKMALSFNAAVLRAWDRLQRFEVAREEAGLSRVMG